MKYFHTILIAILAAQLNAQDYTVKGTILDQSNNAIAYTNVLVLKAADSTLVKGSVSEVDGSYEILGLPSGNYLIKASFVGYIDQFSEPFDLSQEYTVPPLVLIENLENLDEVTVTARRPTVDRKIDRLVFNVENTVVSSGNTFDILRRTPGVTVVQNEIKIRNRAAQVYINDRKVYLTNQELQQLLEGFSGENVKSVEVITTPPARYDAEGGAILNIITSKNLSIGYKGSVFGNNTIAIVPKYSVGTSQYYKTDWLNAFASYTFNSRYDYKNDDSKIVFFDPNGNRDSEWLTDFNKNTRTFSHDLNTILDFTINEKNTVSLSANIQHTPKADDDIDGRTDIFNTQGQLDSLFTTDSYQKKERDNIMLGIDYQASLGDNGATLGASANYINYSNDQRQDVETRYFSPQGNLLMNNSFYTLPTQDANIYTAQLDYSGSIANWSLETGLKYSGINSESSQDFYDTNNGAGVRIDAFSDTFDYDENIFAAYFSFARDWEHWSIKAGLRGEYTDAAGNSISLGEVNTQEYFQAFPTIYLFHAPNDNHSFTFDYSRRISRPRFQSLNPNQYFLNENSFQVGNPNIQPGIYNQVKLGYGYKGVFFIDAYYDWNDNANTILPYQDNENRVLRSLTDNLISDEQYSLDFIYGNYLNDWWFLSVNSSFFYLKSKFNALESDAVNATNDTKGMYLATLNYFTLTADQTFTAEVNTYLLNGYITGSYTYEDPQFSLGIGLRKTFFDGRLSASINAEDLFNTLNIPVASRYLNQDNSYFAKAETRNIRFGLRYKFGNFKLKDNERPTDAEESERLKPKEILN